MSLWKLIEYPYISQIIYPYIKPVDKFVYLLNNNIPFKYAIDYSRYPNKTMNFLIELSNLIGVDDAYNVLMNIPSKYYRINDVNIDNPSTEHISVVEKLDKLINYNYFWCRVFIKFNVDIMMIKYLLHAFVDFYFMELLHYNNINKNYDISLGIITTNMNDTIEYKNTYYKLRHAQIPYIVAYKMCRLDSKYVNKIVDIANAGYYNIDNLSIAVTFDDIQIDFLKLSRHAYTLEEFDANKQKIFNNAVLNQLIDADDFIPHAKKLCI